MAKIIDADNSTGDGTSIGYEVPSSSDTSGVDFTSITGAADTVSSGEVVASSDDSSDGVEKMHVVFVGFLVIGLC